MFGGSKINEKNIIILVILVFYRFLQIIMAQPKRNRKKYTTIQIKLDIARIIREFCLENGKSISGTTEMLWRSHISSSFSTYNKL